jgi:DNA-binding GntR family transcriptional regulator
MAKTVPAATVPAATVPAQAAVPAETAQGTPDEAPVERDRPAGSSERSPKGAPRGSAENLNEVLGSVREAILTGVYAPGQRLIESELCEQHLASRFVVRAALRELAADGLVETQHNRGARVRVVPLEEALEIVEVRMALESLAAGRAAARATPADVLELQQVIARMHSAVDEGELVAYGQLNGALHRAVQRISANATCTRTLDRMRAQIVRHQFALSLQPGRPAVSLPQHERIVTAIATHDVLGAETAMRVHIGSVMEAMRAIPAPGRLAY